MPDDAPRSATLDCLRQLIAFDTTSRNSNLSLIDWAEAHLARHGARIRRGSEQLGRHFIDLLVRRLRHYRRCDSQLRTFR